MLKHAKKLEPADRGKADAVDCDLLAAMLDDDVPPELEMRRDGLVGRGVVFPQELERAIGEHHAEPERRVRTVLLDHADLHLGAAPLQQIGKIESGWPGAEDRNLHPNSSL